MRTAPKPLDDAYAEFFATPRFYAVLMGSFAFIGLVISTVGLYGVLAYAIAQRTREFGIRTALGAPTDPATYAVTIVTLAAASAAACWVPACRATRVDPLVALRHE